MQMAEWRMGRRDDAHDFDGTSSAFTEYHYAVLMPSPSGVVRLSAETYSVLITKAFTYMYGVPYVASL